MRSSSFRRGNLNRLGGFVNQSLDSLGLRHRILEYQLMSKWKQVVGPHIANATVTERVQDGVLFVCCKSSVWANECTFHKQRIIKELNKSAGRQIIKDIRFSSRGYRKALETLLAGQNPPKPKENLDLVEIDETEAKKAENVVSNCPSDELANKIKRAILTSKKLQQSKLKDGWKQCSTCNNLHNGKYNICDNCRTD